MHDHSSHSLSPPPARRVSPFGRLPGGVKLLIAVAVVLGASLCPRTHAAWLILPAAIVLLLFPLAGLRIATLVRRILLLEAFVIGVALLALFSPETWGERWMFFGFLLARCTIALAMMVVFTAATPFSEMLRVFRALHVPGLLVTTLALMHRYVFVLSDESLRMRRARRSRTFGQRKRMEWRTLSSVIGMLFVRASDRADRIYDAMRARGWNND
jgi:cobalt/nickel transport system permease protein